MGTMIIINKATTTTAAVISKIKGFFSTILFFFILQKYQSYFKINKIKLFKTTFLFTEKFHLYKNTLSSKIFK